jgi:NodT family efflux transporter outer membrane factor (OMF) lipoprotein
MPIIRAARSRCLHCGPRRFPPAPVACALALAGGCTSPGEYARNGFQVGPNYHTPPAEVAKEWIEQSDVRVRREGDVDDEWWKVLGDSALNSLVEDAYRQSITLREAGYRVLVARSRLDFSIGNIFPQEQEAVGGYSRNAASRENAHPTIRGGRLLEQQAVAAGAAGTARELARRISISDPAFTNQWEFGFSASWELDFWGRFRRAIEQSARQLEASVENYDDVLVTLLGDVASNYVQLRTLQQQLEYVRANVDLQRQTLDIAKARFQGGESSELDVDQAQSTLSQTEAQVPQLEIDIRRANNRLCVLLGVPTSDLAERLGNGPIPTAPKDVVVGIPADLLRRRPDVRRAERLAAAQCAAIGIAEADFYPAISIVGNLGWSAEQFSDAFQSRAFTGSIGPSYAWKLLNYGRLLSIYHLEEAQFLQLVASYRNAVLQANAEVENGIVRFIKAQARSGSLAESVRAAQKAVDVALAQYKAGMVDFNRVSLLEQNLVQQQDQLAQANGEIAQGLIETYRALGGGWQIREQYPQDTKFNDLRTREEIRSWPKPEYQTKPLPGIPAETVKATPSGN